jgi:hypothetical protein
MTSICLLIVSITFPFAACAKPAQSQDIRINLVREDLYALRRMEVFKKSGEKLSGAVSIESFDPESNSFIMKGVTGETFNLPVSDIQKIEFEQALSQQRQEVQEAAWKINAKPGSTLRYQVSQDALRIEDGDLILPASSSAARIPAPATTPDDTSNKQGKVAKTDKVAEAKKLTYDPSTKMFLVEVQEVTYTKEMVGTSGPSGVRK